MNWLQIATLNGKSRRPAEYFHSLCTDAVQNHREECVFLLIVRLQTFLVGHLFLWKNKISIYVE